MALQYNPQFQLRALSRSIDELQPRQNDNFLHLIALKPHRVRIVCVMEKLVRYLGYGVTKKIAGIRVQTSSISGRYLGLSDRRWHLQPRLVISGAKTGLRTKTSDSKF